MYAKRVKQTKALFRTTRGHTATEFHWFAILMCPDSMFIPVSLFSIDIDSFRSVDNPTCLCDFIYFILFFPLVFLSFVFNLPVTC